MAARLTDRPLVWAHRGASASAPENSLEAFQLANDMKADGIELDVHFTKDGELVVVHDARIDSISNGQGAVLDYTLDELRVFDFRGTFHETCKAIRIPTLGQVYAMVAPTRMVVNVELKADDPALAQACHECAGKHGMSDRIIYSSFNHFHLVHLLAIDPKAFVAPLYSFNMVKPWLYAENMGGRAIHPHHAQVKTLEGYVEQCHRRGIRVHPWTVDNEEDIRFLDRAHVDAIITNRPDFARQVLGY